MSDTVIRVENIGKKYRLGEPVGYQTLRDAIANTLSAPFRFLNSKSEIRNPKFPDEEIWALKDVSFEVKRGEVVGIIGRNGAGKSTLLKILSRITEPTEGHIDIEGRVGSLLEVGTGFHPELTGRENIFLNGAILGMSKADIARKFDEIVAFSEIERFLDTPVKRYSSGMYMRLAFAVAAHLEPEVLVVDEVLAVGDAEFQRKCLGKMQEVGQSGRTVLFVSHNMNAIERLCSSAILLMDGRLKLESNQIESVIRSYMRSGSSSRLDERTDWINPGTAFKNDWLDPIRLCVCDEQGRSLSAPATHNDTVFVRLQGVVKVLDPSLNIGYAVYTEDGTLLYLSFCFDGDVTNWPSLQKGPFILQSRLPAHLLNEGNYRIEFIAGLHFRQWLLQPAANAPAVWFAVQGGFNRSPLWTSKRAGQIAPLMGWESIGAA